MKAIVMAGGEGTRLRPLTVARPKPMIKLLDRPVLEHILALLRENGITDVCMTLKYLPDVIKAHFGDGAKFGMNLHTRTEREPLGTAGGVRACADFVGEEGILVISGDCICDFDLRAWIDFHRTNSADATIVLCNHPDPTEYGTVVTDENGRIVSFLEKPAWENVVTGDISTGIYILSREAVMSIPENTPFDFGRDLFPRMLNEGRRLFAVRADGYWCDIGSPEAYLACCTDALSGKIRLPLLPESTRGVWSSSHLPLGVICAPPVFIGKNTAIEPGAKIGPYAVIGSGSSVERGASVQNSVIDRTAVKSDALLNGAVTDTGSVIGENAVLNRGCTVGSGCRIGKGALIAENVRLWPNVRVGDNSRIYANITDSSSKNELVFSSCGVMRGVFGGDITPEVCLAIGSAAAPGPVGIAHDGSGPAALLAEAVSCGVLAAGGEVLATDAPYAAAAAFAGALYNLMSTIFVSCTEHEAVITFFGKNGGTLTRAEERRFEAALRGETKRAPFHAVASPSHVSGICGAFSARASEYARRGNSITVSSDGHGPENRTLRSALTSAGCSVVSKTTGVPCFEVSAGGFALSAHDENGLHIDSDRMLLITARCAFERGIRDIAAPFSAPAALDRLAEHMGGRIIRLGRDGEAAEELAAAQPFMRFGTFAAALICGVMREKGMPLSKLREEIPDFSTARREVPVVRARGELMAAVRAVCTGYSVELVEGLSAQIGSTGRVFVTPCRTHPALIIRAESESEEMAEELCADFERLTRRLDSEA